MAAGFDGSSPWYVYGATIVLVVLLETISTHLSKTIDISEKEVVSMSSGISLVMIGTCNVATGIVCSAVASALLP